VSCRGAHQGGGGGGAYCRIGCKVLCVNDAVVDAGLWYCRPQLTVAVKHTILHLQCSC
jgi:hypothetical protein